MAKNRDFSKFPNAITVLDNGNVGIGTSTPLSLTNYTALEIKGTNAGVVAVSSNAGGSFGRMYSTGSLVYIGTSSNHPVVFDTNDTERMRITSTGNIGIGTSSPIGPLDIAVPATGSAIAATNAQQAYDYSRLRIKHYTDSNLGLSIGYAGANQTYIQACYNQGSVAPLTLNPFGGNIGIGTTSPQSPLQVVGTGPGGLGTINLKGASAHLGYQDTAGTFKGWIGYYDAGIHGNDINLNIKTGYKEASNIVFSANGDGTEAMRINGTGNVGIGNSSPLQALGRTLTVEGTGIFQSSSTGGNYNENLRLNRAGNGYSALGMGGSYNSVSGTAAGQWTLVAAPVGLNYKFYLDYAGTETFTVRTTGQILQNGVGLVQVVPIGPTATNLSYSGTINGQYTVGSASIPSTAQWLLADVFITANISDHQNFMITRFNFGAQKNWVDTRGNNPANEFGNLTQGDVCILTYNGESDGYTPNYGIWKTSVLIPSVGRNIWINNYGNSSSSGYLYFIVRGYSL